MNIEGALRSPQSEVTNLEEALEKAVVHSGGFTLVEMMVSILVMTVGMLGLLRAIDLSLKENTKNLLRDEAVRVGEQHLARLRGTPFEEISSTRTVHAPRIIRGVPFDYRVESSTQVLADDSRGPSSKQLTVVVKWGYGNLTSQTTATSVVAR